MKMWNKRSVSLSIYRVIWHTIWRKKKYLYQWMSKQWRLVMKYYYIQIQNFKIISIYIQHILRNIGSTLDFILFLFFSTGNVIGTQYITLIKSCWYNHLSCTVISYWNQREFGTTIEDESAYRVLLCISL